MKQRRLAVLLSLLAVMGVLTGTAHLGWWALPTRPLTVIFGTGAPIQATAPSSPPMDPATARRTALRAFLDDPAAHDADSDLQFESDLPRRLNLPPLTAGGAPATPPRREPSPGSSPGAELRRRQLSEALAQTTEPAARAQIQREIAALRPPHPASSDPAPPESEYAPLLRAALADRPGGAATLSVTSFVRIDRLARGFGIDAATRAAWWGAQLDQQPQWSSAPTSRLVQGLNALLDPADAEALRPLRPLLAQPLVERLLAEGPQQWCQEAAQAAAAIQLLHRCTAIDATVADNWRPRLTAMLQWPKGEEPPWLIELPDRPFEQLCRIARELRVPPSDVQHWVQTRILRGQTWRSEPIAQVVRKLQALAPRRSNAPPEAVAELVGVILRRATASASDCRALALQDEYSRFQLFLERDQRIALAQTWMSHVDGDGTILADLTVTQFERLRMGIMQYGNDQLGNLLHAFVNSGVAWRGGDAASYQTLLWLINLYDDYRDLSAARRVVVAELRDRLKRQPHGWVDPSLMYHWRDFVELVWKNLQTVDLPAEQQEQIIVELLEAPDNWALARSRVERSASNAPRTGRQMLEAYLRTRGIGMIHYWSEGWRYDNEHEIWEQLATLIEAGVRAGRLAPRPSTLDLVSSLRMQLDGDLADWRSFLEARAEAAAAGSEERVMWLLGRAFAEEIDGWQPMVAAGLPWLERARAAAGDDLLRGKVDAVLALHLAMIERFDEANAVAVGIGTPTSPRDVWVGQVRAAVEGARVQTARDRAQVGSRP